MSDTVFKRNIFAQKYFDAKTMELGRVAAKLSECYLNLIKVKPDCSCCSACVQKMLHCICDNISFINSQTAFDNSFSILSEPADKEIYLPLWIETFRLRLEQLLDNLSNVVAKNRKKRDC